MLKKLVVLIITISISKSVHANSYETYAECAKTCPTSESNWIQNTCDTSIYGHNDRNKGPFICREVFTGCFPTEATVQTLDGQKSMRDLNVGDTILVASPDGSPKYSKMYAWLQHSFSIAGTYLRMTTESGHRLDITDSHIMFAKRFPMGTPAKNIKVGDSVWVNYANNTYNMELSKVIHVAKEPLSGAHVPATMDGTLFVDGVLASSYALDNHYIGHNVIHKLFAPLRWFHHASDAAWGSDANDKFDLWQPKNAVLWYAEGLKQLNKMVFK